MSADTTVVIAARRGYDGELEYTAKCVQAAEDLFDPDPTVALDTAHSLFGVPGLQWFRGPQGLGAAKQLAGLIKQDLGRHGELEYHHLPMIEIADDGVHQLSRKGNRKEKEADTPAWFRDAEPTPHSRHVRRSVTETRSVIVSEDGHRSVRGSRSVIHSVSGTGPTEPNWGDRR